MQSASSTRCVLYTRLRMRAVPTPRAMRSSRLMILAADKGGRVRRGIGGRTLFHSSARPRGLQANWMTIRKTLRVYGRRKLISGA